MKVSLNSVESLLYHSLGHGKMLISSKPRVLQSFITNLIRKFPDIDHFGTIKILIWIQKTEVLETTVQLSDSLMDYSRIQFNGHDSLSANTITFIRCFAIFRKDSISNVQWYGWGLMQTIRKAELVNVEQVEKCY